MKVDKKMIEANSPIVKVKGNFYINFQGNKLPLEGFMGIHPQPKIVDEFYTKPEDMQVKLLNTLYWGKRQFDICFIDGRMKTKEELEADGDLPEQLTALYEMMKEDLYKSYKQESSFIYKYFD